MSCVSPRQLLESLSAKLLEALQGCSINGESVGTAGVLAFKCGPLFAALTGGTLAAYTAFTFSFTQVGPILCDLILFLFSLGFMP